MSKRPGSYWRGDRQCRGEGFQQGPRFGPRYGAGGWVREALGDDTSDSAQRFAMETLSAASLEAVHDYAVGMDALSEAGSMRPYGVF